MLILINLHPERGRRRRPSPFAATAALGGRLTMLRDRYLLSAVAAVLVACAAVGGLYTTQQQERDGLATQEEGAVRDSARFATVIAARVRATARRDSLARELRAIAAIDSNRYVWAHLLDEVSRTLPVYTWLTSVQQTSAPAAPPVLLAKAEPKGAKPGGAASDTRKDGADTASTAIRFRLVGQTVDLQALTQFMRDLESSPFVRSVQLAHSEPVAGGNAAAGAGRDITEFTLDAEFEHAPRSALRTTSIIVPVR